MKRSELLKSWLGTSVDSSMTIDDDTCLGDAGLPVEAARKRAIAMVDLRREGGVYYAAMVESVRRGSRDQFRPLPEVASEIDAAENDLMPEDVYYRLRRHVSEIHRWGAAVIGGRQLAEAVGDAGIGRGGWDPWSPQGQAQGLNDLRMPWPEFWAQFVRPIQSEIKAVIDAK